MQAPSCAEHDISFQDAHKRALPRILQRKRELHTWIRENYIKPMRRWCRANRHYQFGAKLGVITRCVSTKRAKVYRKRLVRKV
jgi:hypothetical protein